jgi:hypothetical protein
MNDELGQEALDDAASFASDLYSAEFIVDKKRGSYRGKKVMLYRVRWTGYTEADDTWEPIENLNEALLSDFEESLKQRRPRQQHSPSQEDAPPVTWSSLLTMLGSCPLERLPDCLHPRTSAASQENRLPEQKRVSVDVEGKKLTVNCYVRPSNTVSPSNSLNQKFAEVATFQTENCRQTNVIASAQPENEPERLSCSSRPRWKQAAPCRSPLANVLMNC